METETDEILAYIKALTDATKAGRIHWLKANPSTLAWTSMSPKPARVVLQRLAQAPFRGPGGNSFIAYNYIIQGFEPTNNIEQFSYDGGKSTRIREALEELYNTGEAAIARKSLDFFKSILPP